jgi:hypothetical protein
MTKYKNDFDKEHYDHIHLIAEKGFKAKVIEAAKKEDKTHSAYIVEAVEEKIEKR